MPSNTRVAPHVQAAWALAIGVAVVAAGIDRPHAGLVDAAVCPGLLEGVAAALARALPSTGVGQIVGAQNAVALGAAASAFSWLTMAVGSRPIVTLAAAAAVVVTPALARTEAPGDALAFAAASLALAGLAAAGARAGGRNLGRLAILILIALLSALAPAATLPLAAAGALTVGSLSSPLTPARRSTAVAASALVVLAAGGLTSWLVPPALSTSAAHCGPLAVFGWSLASVTTNFALAFSGVGAAVIAFAVFGVLAGGLGVRPLLSPPVILLVLAPIAVVGTESAAARALALPLAAIWAFAAVGMSALVNRAEGRAARAGALVFVLLVPVLQHARAAERPESGQTGDWGHRAMTHDRAAAVIAAMAPGAWLVNEDALTEVVLRSVANTKGIVRVAARGADVRRAPDSTEVYALPRAQRALQLEGFRPRATGRVGAPGLSVLDEDYGCARPDATWQPWRPPSDATGFALVAGDDRARGPVIMYLAADALPAVTGHDPSPVATRGIYIWDYDTTSARDRARLDTDSRNDAIGDAQAVGTTRFLKRIEFWRATGAGRVIALDVMGPFAAAVFRLAPDAASPPPVICPTFVAPIESLGTVR